MKRIWSMILVLLLGVCLIGQAEELPQTIERNVPLEGTDEARTYTLVKDGQGRFSIYVDEGIYEAVQNDAGMTIQQKDGGSAKMVLTILDGSPVKLRDDFVTPEMKNEDSFWEEEFDTPNPGCSVVFEQDGMARSVYWFDAGDGKALMADFSLQPEEQEGHGVRMWDMLATLVF
jgi:hypothetical protein